MKQGTREVGMPTIILSKDGEVFREVRLIKERLTIGRAPYNDIILDDLAISSEHAVIVTRDGDSFLEDLNSTNGTQVNGQPIRTHFLREGDLIELAQYCIHYICGYIPTSSSHLPRLVILDGPNSGREVVLRKPMTTLGRFDEQVAVLVREHGRFVLSPVQGATRPLLNEQPVKEPGHQVVHGDVIDLCGVRLKFLTS
jgi:pSer/pThr/pTyr-binding forkhead associated (FHA) protein